MEDESILYEKSQRTARITLNRPKILNALTSRMANVLSDRVRDARDDHKIRVLVITGAGRAFSAGADVNRLYEDGLDGFRRLVQNLSEALRMIRHFPKPTIAALNGVAVGGGFELSLQCDIRIAVNSAKIGSSEVTMGQPTTNGTAYLLSRLIGEARAKELALTGKLITAFDALEWGILNAIADEDRFEDLICEWTEALTAGSPIAIDWVKRSFEMSRVAQSADATSLFEAEAATQCFITEDQKEGILSFKEKRKPQWSGS